MATWVEIEDKLINLDDISRIRIDRLRSRPTLILEIRQSNDYFTFSENAEQAYYDLKRLVCKT